MRTSKFVRTQRRTTTNLSAWGQFQRLYWETGVTPTSDRGKTLRGTLYAKFVALPRRERVRLEGQAAARADHVRRFGASLSENYTGVNDLGTSGARASARRRAFSQTVQNIADDSAWSAGSAIQGPWYGVRPELIDGAPLAQIERLLEPTFRYDGVAVKNPPGSHQPE